MASRRAPLDARVRQLRGLARRKADRDAAGVALVESATVLDVALDAGLDVVRVIVESDRADATDERVVDRAVRSGAEVFDVGAGTLAGLVSAKTPQPVAAVVARPQASLAEVVAAASLAVVVVELADPGNLGTVVRSAEAAGADCVVVTGTSVDVWSPKVVRSSAGAVFLVPVVEAATADGLAALADAGLSCLGADAASGVPYDHADLTAPVALVVGNEARGLSPEVVERLDGRIHIPLAGRSESLNAAMAASVLVFEAARQRRQLVRPE